VGGKGIGTGSWADIGIHLNWGKGGGIKHVSSELDRLIPEVYKEGLDTV